MRADPFLAGFKKTSEYLNHVRAVAERPDVVNDMRVLADYGHAPVRALNRHLTGAPVPHLDQHFNSNLGKIAYEAIGVQEYEVTEHREAVGGPIVVEGATFRRRTEPLISIRRKHPRPGGDEFPIRSREGYQLVKPGLDPQKRTQKENAVHVPTLREALPLLDKGYHLRMGRKGVRPSLIRKESLIIQC
jgi:hypothetical protein